VKLSLFEALVAWLYKIDIHSLESGQDEPSQSKLEAVLIETRNLLYLNVCSQWLSANLVTWRWNIFSTSDLSKVITTDLLASYHRLPLPSETCKYIPVFSDHPCRVSIKNLFMFSGGKNRTDGSGPSTASHG